ncbi:LOW QUALITY PROTEIN: capsular polysaccharide synthesis enzyme CpsE [Vibrio sp. JCM 19053]|nr:LOW QUALITY PROTEIN: capsular polysaccharide synthesis enzyme CpsE [Vibrio sp. JCM 19053]
MSRNTPTNVNLSWYQTLKSQEQPVLIYQMGKVGSSALEHSIPDSIHLHDLMTVDAQKQISPVRAQLHKPQINALKRRLKRITMSRMLKRKKKSSNYLAGATDRTKCLNVLSSTSFWMADKYLKDDSAIRTERPQLLQEAFDKHMNHQYALQWFDNEIKQLTGIDVFNESFNHEVGYQTYHNNNFSLLVIRSDKLTKANSAVEDFLGYPVDVVYENQSDNKWYSPLMKEFKTQFQPTPEYVEEMLNSKLTKHFFSNTEITDLKQQYLTN